MVGAAVRNFSYYPLRVTSNSMSPTAAKGDWVVISPRQGTTEAVHRGDIVLFEFPLGDAGRAIKRVVAVAGDRVQAEGDEVRVDPQGRATNSTSEEIVVPEGYYYILGDNLASSIDSRSLGLLHHTQVLGTVSAVITKPWK
jgi:signal peptidase I